MEKIEFLILSHDFKQAEELLFYQGFSLNDLSDDAFALFKEWIETPKEY